VSYGAAVRDSGPVGWWRLDERSGSAGFDSSGNGNDLALTGHYYQAVPGASSGDARRVATRFGGDAFNDGNGDLGDVFDFAGNARSRSRPGSVCTAALTSLPSTTGR
jgi:hypothetical protein